MRETFPAERGLYEIHVEREYIMEDARISFCNLNNEPILGLTAATISQTNCEQYPYKPNWVKTRSMKDIQLFDEISLQPMGSISEFTISKIMKQGGDTHSTTLKDALINVKGTSLKKMVTLIKNFNKQYLRLNLRKDKFRVRRKILSDNFINKQDFISVYDIKNIQLSVLFPKGKRLTVSIENMIKHRQTEFKDVIDLLVVNQIQLVIVQSLKVSHQIAHVKSIRLQKNVSFLKKLVEEGIFNLEELGESDAEIAKLMKSCYNLINIDTSTIEIPHDFSEYWPFFIDLTNSVHQFLLQPGADFDGKKSEMLPGNDSMSVVLPSGRTLPERKVGILRFMNLKFFLSMTKISIKILNHPFDVNLLMKRRIITEYLNKINNEFNEKTIIQQIRQYKKMKSHHLLEVNLQELTLDVVDLADPTTSMKIEECEKKVLKFIQFTDPFFRDKNSEIFESLSAFKIKLFAHSFSIRSMDYPLDLFKVKFFSIESQIVRSKLNMELMEKRTKNQYGSEKVFFNFDVFMDRPSITYGLNLLFALRAVYKFVMKVKEAATRVQTMFESKIKVAKHISTEISSSMAGISNMEIDQGQYLETESIEDVQEQDKWNKIANQANANKKVKFWDILRYKFHGKFICRVMDFRMNILTDTSPYSLSCLQMNSNIFYLSYKSREVKLYTEKIFLQKLSQVYSEKHLKKIFALGPKETSIIHFPVVEALIRWEWKPENFRYDHYFLKEGALLNFRSLHAGGNFRSKTLVFDFSFNIPKKEDSESGEFNAKNTRQVMQKSKVPIVNVQSDIITWLVQIPQLSKEYLTLLGINPFKYSKNIEFMYFK